MAKMTLKLPKLGVSMHEGTVTEWFVASGDSVAQGQKIYVVRNAKRRPSKLNRHLPE